MRPETYKTKQKEAVLSYLQSLAGGHVSAKEIAEYLQECGMRVGLTTVYRQLDRLVEDGAARRYTTDSAAGAYYEYVGGAACSGHFHLKCDGCGMLIHMQCDFLVKAGEHISHEHNFEINTGKTVFYGKCEACAENPVKI